MTLPAPLVDSVADAHVGSLWIHGLRADGSATTRPALDGDRDVDVAIVGGGFSGLWTAHSLVSAEPGLRVAVIEREVVGFGASGRNGGWAVGELACGFDGYAKRTSPDAARRLLHAVFDAVDEIGRVAEAEGIDCRYAKGGWIRVARNQPQADRQRDEVAHERANGFGPDVLRLLEPDEARAHFGATDVRGGVFFEPCASLDPARLAAGLAAACERRGVEIFEGSEAVAIDGGSLTVEAGPPGGASRHTVRAADVVLATEAYTRDLPGRRRDLLPVYSLMVATEPLAPEVFDELGLAGRPTFSDDRHMVIYGQRTADDRLAFGGRGVPYLFGSAISAKAEAHLPSHELLGETLVELSPLLADACITHRWGGVLGIPRNWVPGVRLDPVEGAPGRRLGVLGGYVGEGVAAANLAGRTMADLILGRSSTDSDLVDLAWVGQGARSWEPEPLRWLGVRSSRRILSMADDREFRTDRPATAAYKLSRLLRGA